jgi:hypothetical protein
MNLSGASNFLEVIMLKLNASYSKKVPAEGEYSSQSYHASIEVELPDGLSQDQLNSKIHETFAMVRDSVEAELHGNPPGKQAQVPVQEASQNTPQGYPAQAHRGTDVPASPKQISYLLSLASKRGITPAQIAAQQNVSSVDQLSRRQCSSLIEQWRAA